VGLMTGNVEDFSGIDDREYIGSHWDQRLMEIMHFQLILIEQACLLPRPQLRGLNDPERGVSQWDE
jgi:hypothetical protein